MTPPSVPIGVRASFEGTLSVFMAKEAERKTGIFGGSPRQKEGQKQVSGVFPDPLNMHG